jgi:uncharacterized protein YjaG (DUF416 family)
MKRKDYALFAVILALFACIAGLFVSDLKEGSFLVLPVAIQTIGTLGMSDKEKDEEKEEKKKKDSKK